MDVRAGVHRPAHLTMASASAEQYGAWYRAPRGAWIGEIEFRLLRDMLAPHSGESLLDVGCGTGYFTRRFAREAGVVATGVDPDEGALAYARAHAAEREAYVPGLAEALPFADGSFDCTISVTALCFVRAQGKAVSELLRVTRRRFALGLLNRGSLLCGRKAGRGAYAGAHWHTPQEARALFDGQPVRDLELRSAVFLPEAGALARAAERIVPDRCLCGALLALAGSVAVPARN